MDLGGEEIDELIIEDNSEVRNDETVNGKIDDVKQV